LIPLFLINGAGLEGSVVNDCRGQSEPTTAPPAGGRARASSQKAELTPCALIPLFLINGAGLEGSVVNDCRGQSEPTTAPPAGGRARASSQKSGIDALCVDCAFSNKKTAAFAAVFSFTLPVFSACGPHRQGGCRSFQNSTDCYTPRPCRQAYTSAAAVHLLQ